MRLPVRRARGNSTYKVLMLIVSELRERGHWVLTRPKCIFSEARAPCSLFLSARWFCRLSFFTELNLLKGLSRIQYPFLRVGQCTRETLSLSLRPESDTDRVTADTRAVRRAARRERATGPGHGSCAAHPSCGVSG